MTGPLVLPIVALLVIAGLAAAETADRTRVLLRSDQEAAGLLGPLDAAVAALQAERVAAGEYAAAPNAGRANRLSTLAAATDSAVSHTWQGIAADEVPQAATALQTLATDLNGLPELRRKVMSRQQDGAAAAAAYTAIVDAAFTVEGMSTSSVPTGLPDSARAGEMLAREDTALRSAQAAGRLSADQYQLFLGAAYARDQLAIVATAAQPPAAQTAVQAAEAAVRAAGPGTFGRGALAAAQPARWNPAADALAQSLAASTGEGRRAASADPYSAVLLSPSGVIALLALLAAVGALILARRVGRGRDAELTVLRDFALDLADRRLPEALRRLRGGETIDVRAALPATGPGGELGEIAAALGAVERAALEVAAERAEVLSGVTGVFVNLARRSQVLVHRQLKLLDAMERRTDQPRELEELFKLDHLTTRMRRHAENLLILSGAAPGRAWRRPVPLVDVVRAAVAEVEDYARVEVRRMPEAALSGAAVADLTHLLAELVENATAFSPPDTRVHVSGEAVGTGYVLEIEDRGLGMGADALAAANRRVAASAATREGDFFSSEFDCDRLGLFVVSRLSRRHNLSVTLRSSSWGGIVAVVLLPESLLAPPAAPPADPQPRATSVQHAPAPTAASSGGVGAELVPRPDRLPTRVPQASLAPQLREESGEGPGTGRGTRTPESARATMAALQQGWQAGRAASAAARRRSR